MNPNPRHSCRRSRQIPRLSTAHGSSSSTEAGSSPSLPRVAGVSNPEARSAEAGTVDEPVAVWLTDPGVLDCCICFEPLSIPVFQCENGHTACSSCWLKIHNKCSSCSRPIGDSRCRAIEKVLESAKSACQNKQYGCKETVRYGHKTEHEKTCRYAPCTCPLPTCSFVSSLEQLSLHLTANHPGSAVRFNFSRNFEVGLDTEGPSFLILQEKKGKALFVLHLLNERIGRVIWLSLVSSGPSKDFWYNFTARGKGKNLSSQSVTARTRGGASNANGIPSEAFLVIPPEGFLVIPPGEFALDLKIKGVRFEE